MKIYLPAAALAALLSTPAAAQVSWFGEGYIGAGSSDYVNTDDSEADSLSHLSFGGVAGFDYNGFRAYIDGHGLRRSLESGQDFDDYAPEDASSYGLHVGYEFNPAFGPLYVGAFVGRNEFQGDDASSTNGTVSGDLYGIEAEAMLGNTSVFAQIGSAEMIGDGTDTAFDGRFYRVGAAHDFNHFTVVGDFEWGTSPDVFEDSGDWGEYTSFGVTFETPITDAVYGYLALNRTEITANDEDMARETRVELGVRFNYGPRTRTNLTTSYNPGLAAAWAETLD